jgi:hypothetical protein
MPRGGSTIIYGKITISSEVDSLDKIMDKLDAILANYGYPDLQEKKEGGDSNAPYFKKKEEGLTEAIPDEVKNLLKNAKPAEDSVKADWGDDELEENSEDDLDLAEKFDDQA